MDQNIYYTPDERYPLFIINHQVGLMLASAWYYQVQCYDFFFRSKTWLKSAWSMTNKEILVRILMVAGKDALHRMEFIEWL